MAKFANYLFLINSEAIHILIKILSGYRPFFLYFLRLLFITIIAEIYLILGGILLIFSRETSVAFGVL